MTERPSVRAPRPPHRADPRPTLDTVARAAGVSRQTVSNVLNAPDRVHASTRTRVQGAIADLGYRPSLAAQQLRTRRSHTLGLRLEPARDGINGSVLDRFLHALVDGAQDAGYRVLLYTAPDDEAEVQAYGDLVATSQLDGLVLTSTHHGDPRTAWLEQHRVPFSTFGRPWGAPAVRHPWVDVDGSAGTAAAVRHLVDAGHRRIGFLGWPAGSGSGDDRRTGWRRGLEQAGIGVDPALDAAVQDGVTSGRAAADRASRLDDPPTALVCVSDSLALGVQAHGAAAAGRPVAVVGFDDTPVAAAVGLTSVAQPLAEAARECLGQLLAGIEGDEAVPAVPVLLPPSLVVRTSSPPPDRTAR